MPLIFNRLTATSLLAMSSLIISMDQKPIHRDIVVQRITAITNPLRANFLHKKHSLMIASKGGIHEVDWKQDKPIRCIIPMQDFNTCCINQQRNAVAGMNYDSLGKTTTYLYDVNKEAITWQQTFANNPSFPTCTFTPSGNLYVVDNHGDIHCSNNKSYVLPKTEQGLITNVVADNTEEKIIFAQYINDERSILKTVTFNADQTLITKSFVKNAPHTKEDPSEDTPKTKKHSPIQKLVACHFYLNNFWFLYDHTNATFIEKTTELSKDCCSLAFHPKNASQLALLTKKGFVKIYDFRKNETISETRNSLWVSTSNSRITQSDIDFSEDGENIAVVIGTKRYDKNNNILFILSNLYSKKDK